MHSINMFCTYEIREMRLQMYLTPFLWASLLHLLGQFLWHMTHVWPLGGQIPLCTITYKIRTYIHSFLVLGVKWIFRTLILYFDGMQTIFSYVFYSKLQFISENMLKPCASFSLCLQVMRLLWCRLLLKPLSQLEHMNVLIASWTSLKLMSTQSFFVQKYCHKYRTLNGSFPSWNMEMWSVS